MAFKRGDMVTICPPYTNDPIVVELQPHARVAEVRGDEYLVQLGTTWPPNQLFGPYPEERLKAGWWQRR